MTKMITQAMLATEGQKKHLVRLIQDALPDTKWIENLVDRFCSEKKNAQLLIEAGDELKTVRKYLSDQVKRLSDSALYADQVVISGHGYLSGYDEARRIEAQIMILRYYNWDLNVNWILNEQQLQLLAKPLPLGSEGYFAVVFDPIMITYHEGDPSVDQSGPVTRVLEALSKQREERVVNYRNGELDRMHYRRSEKSAKKMKQLWESQGCPTGIFLIPAQLGFEYRGNSVLRVSEVIRGSEFPLDAYEVLQMVLTHPDRMQPDNDLWIDLPGSEYSPNADGVFECALCVGFGNNDLGLDSVDLGLGYSNVDFPRARSGSASGFLL